MKPFGSRGFTLVEVLVTCAVVGVIAGVALPGYQSQLQQARRSDAVAALTRLQAAQERLQAGHGIYSADLAALQIAPRSGEGLYDLRIELTGADSYRAHAVARADGAQAGDAACAALTLEVRRGFASIGPSARCWNR